MKRLFVLRPEPGASATVEAARAEGLDAVPMPLFRIEPVAWEAPEAGGFDAVLLTSANGVRHAGDQLLQLRGLKAYCVGKATAAAARGAGFGAAAVGEAGVERLLASIAPDERLLHLAGEDRTDVADEDGRLTVLTVYRAVELPPPAGIEAVQGAVVTLHSARAARRFAALVDACGINRSRIAVAAISETVLNEAAKGWAQAEAADTPTSPSLLALARSMCNKPAQS